MNAAHMLIERVTDDGDRTNLAVILRPAEKGIQALLVADEKGRWSIPGGHAKGSETPREACVREVKEETGLDVELEPLFQADHAARKIVATLFYATVEPGTEGRPGGGDVTEVRWAYLDELENLNGTDRLAIHVAVNRIHSTQAIVDNEIELAEKRGFAVGNVAVPVVASVGMYIRLNGPGAQVGARKLAEWMESLGWPVTLVASTLFESTVDALERARRSRRLTPMLHCLLNVSDALWRYESAVVPALEQQRTVIETGPELDRTRFNALAPDLRDELLQRLPTPVISRNVGEQLAELQEIKDSIEQMLQ